MDLAKKLTRAESFVVVVVLFLKKELLSSKSEREGSQGQFHLKSAYSSRVAMTLVAGPKRHSWVTLKAEEEFEEDISL